MGAPGGGLMGKGVVGATVGWGATSQWGGVGAIVGGGSIVRVSSTSKKRPSHHKQKSPKQFELKQS